MLHPPSVNFHLVGGANLPSPLTAVDQLDTGFPPLSDLTQLVLSWKPRQSASTSSVYCQTTITGCMESWLPSPVPAASQRPLQDGQKKKKQGRTISECLKQRPVETSDTVLPSRTDVATVCNSAPPSTATDAVLVTDSAICPVASLIGDQTGRLSSVDCDSCHQSSVIAADQLATDTARLQTVDNSEIVAAVKQHSVSNSPSEAVCCPPTAGATVTLLNSAIVSPVTAANESTSGSESCCQSHISASAVYNSGKTSGVSGAGTRSSSPRSLYLPSSVNHCNTAVSASTRSTCRVTERVTSGTVLVDMDIGSNVLGSGLMYGTYLYHGGRLVLGQQRQNTTTAWPLLPELNLASPPVYLLSAARPVVMPSTNMYAITVPSDSLLTGLRVICDGVSNVVDSIQLPTSISDDRLPESSPAVASGAGENKQVHRMSNDVAQPSNEGAGPDHPAESAEVPAADSLHIERCDADNDCNDDCGSNTVLVSTAMSTDDRLQHKSHAGLADACAVGVGDVLATKNFNNEIVLSSRTQLAVPAATQSSSARSPSVHVMDVESHSANDNSALRGVSASHCDSSADIQGAISVNSLPCVSSDLLTTECLVSSEATSVQKTDIAPTRSSRQNGTKRKFLSQSTYEYCPRSKTGRVDSGKRISRYICPPPDSANGRDSEIIHVMDRLCEKSLDQYLYSVDNHVSATSQSLDTSLFPSAAEDQINMINAHPDSALRACSSFAKYPLSLHSATVTTTAQPRVSVQECQQPTNQVSSDLNDEGLRPTETQPSHLQFQDNSMRTEKVSCQSKGFALVNFLSTTATSSLAVSSASQQSSSLDAVQMSKKAATEKNSNTLQADQVLTHNHSFIPISKITNSAIACDSASGLLSDDLSLTDNDFAMILSDTDDPGMFSVSSRKSLDMGYWGLGFSSTCGRLLDRTKDGTGIEPVHTYVEDIYQSAGSMFREPSCVPVNDYIVHDHADPSNKTCFNVSSLTCKPTSVGCLSLPPQSAYSLSNSASIATHTMLNYSLVSTHQLPVLDTGSHNRLYEPNSTHTSDATTVSSVRGIFSLAHHAVQPSPVSRNPPTSESASCSEPVHSTSVLWSPCNGTSRLSRTTTLGDHRQLTNVPSQCRLPSSTVPDVDWRVPEPSSFVPLYNSWSDNIYSANYCAIQPLPRTSSFGTGQSINAQTDIGNIQSVFNHSEIYSSSETDHEKFRGRHSDGEFCPFPSNRNKDKHVSLNSQYTSHQKVPSSCSQRSWTYAECGIAPQPYTCTSSAVWQPPSSSYTSVAMTFDLSRPATSSLPTSACRLPSFSFATVPPVPDFLSLSFPVTAASTSAVAGIGSEVGSWPVTLTASHPTTSVVVCHGWSPIFPQHTGLQPRHNQSSTSLATVSGTLRPDARADVTYTVPSFIHTDKQSQKHPSSFKAHLPQVYPLWHGTDHMPVEMCHLPPVSMVNSDAQLFPQPLNPIHGRGLYPSSKAGFMTSTLTSPPLHHRPMHSNQHTSIYNAGDKQLRFEAPFSLPRLPLTSQVLNFSASDMAPASFRTVTSEMYHNPTFDVGNMPVHVTTDADSRQAQNVAQTRPVPRAANVKRQTTKYPKQLKHNATSLCVGYPASHASSQPMARDIPTYFPTGPFVGSCSLEHGMAVELPRSLDVTTKTNSQTTAVNQRHNFDIGAFISELSSNSSQAVTAPAAIRRLDFPTPPMHVLQEPVGMTGQCLQQVQCNRTSAPVPHHTSHNFALHNMSINSLLRDNPYPHVNRYAACSENVNHSASVLPQFDVPTLNFSIRSQTNEANFDRPHNNKARHS